MQIRPLAAAALLVLGIGCDDPEVQGKIADVLEHGAASAELRCSFHSESTAISDTPKWILYSANKFIDGTCQVQVCVSRTGDYIYTGPTFGDIRCSNHLWPRFDSRSINCQGYFDYDITTNLASTTRPYRPFIDGVYVEVKDSLASISLRDAYFLQGTNSCFGSGSTCSDPEPWFSYDITGSSCTGRNLAAFGVEE